ncbi:HVO_A0114 family putative DNA-binding protein [Halovenus aranensis]|nr:helix-turn-helix domain-containing protein [Halovenus aranensis]
MSDWKKKQNSNNNSEEGESESARVLTRSKVGEKLSIAGFGDVLVLSHEAADQVLTPARREIIKSLAAHDASSLRELAEIVDRNPGNMSRDMKVLVAENIIRYVDEGKSKRPELRHDTIISEPLITSEIPVQQATKSNFEANGECRSDE